LAEHNSVIISVDDLQIWRVTANILNKQLWTSDKGGPPAWGLDVGLTAPHIVMNCFKGPQTLMDTLAGLGIGQDLEVMVLFYYLPLKAQIMVTSALNKK
jgi:hypothetical protein